MILENQLALLAEDLSSTALGRSLLRPFKHVIPCDTEFEFGGRDGNLPRGVCLVAVDLVTKKIWRVRRGEFGAQAPFPTGPETLFVAYYASAELGLFRANGWAMPARILDLFCEFRALTNGRLIQDPAEKKKKGEGRESRDGLIAALTYFGLDTIGAIYKQEMIALILRGGPWTEEEWQKILDYCEGDVAALVRLLLAMLPHIESDHALFCHHRNTPAIAKSHPLDPALLRGRYMASASAMETLGIPIDTDLRGRQLNHWDVITGGLIREIDAPFGVYREDGSFSNELFERLLVSRDIPWMRHPSGALDLSQNTFRSMVKAYPELAPLHELRYTLGQLRLNELQVGEDGQNRCLLSAFRSVTGRNQPSASKYIFGPAVWIRGLIKPPKGMGVAYIDWSSQEFGIAAALSGDVNMKAAYEAGDVYLAFGKQCGRLPPDATKQSHGAEREMLKQCVLGIGYGMGERTLAFKIGEPEAVARELLRVHHATYPTMWRWSDAAVDAAMLGRTLWTVFGWPVRIGLDPNPRGLRNFPAQAHGSELLRLACCLATERGIPVCAPVHDAVMIYSPLERLESDVAAMREAMAEASHIVLGGFELRTDARLVHYPDRYMDEERGRVMWDTVMRLLIQAEARELKAVG